MNPSIVEKFIAASKTVNMKDVSKKEILEYVVTERAFSAADFHTLIDDSQDWVAVLVTHIHLDHIIDTLLSEVCVNPSALSGNSKRMGFLEKTAFCHGVGALTIASFRVAEKVNAMRNKFAHKLVFSVSDQLVTDLRHMAKLEFGSRLTERKEFIAAENNLLDFKLVLKLIVLFVEEERMAYLARCLFLARDAADFEDMLASSRKNLAKIAARRPFEI